MLVNQHTPAASLPCVMVKDCLVSWSHHGLILSLAKFAPFCGREVLLSIVILLPVLVTSFKHRSKLQTIKVNSTNCISTQ
jgi:hypothetical protein